VGDRAKMEGHALGGHISPCQPGRADQDMDFVTDAGEPSRHIGGIGAKPSRVCLTRVLRGEIKDLELALGDGADGPILVRTGGRPR